MNSVRLFLVTGMFGLLLTSCVASLRNDTRYASFIGRKFKTKVDLFLVERYNKYSLEGERKSDVVRESKPTFNEFRDGLWVDKSKRRKYKLIIPSGTVVQITDIVYVFNPEVGGCHEWYGVFVSPPEGVDLGKNILLDSDYRDHGDSAPLVPPFIHKEGYRSLFVPVDEAE